ncbi:MAG: TonB-dependent receptor [Acidobacteria bacterium]|nr:TonB-dependent receptor [Acidobacteriota bacterium]
MFTVFVRACLAAVVSLVLTGQAFALTGRVVNASGAPVAGAEISILGRPGTTVTDVDGRFTWLPDPPVPFEVLVVAPGGMFMKPILVTDLEPAELLVLTVENLVSERLVVSGAAPDIEATPTAATTSLSHAELQTRLPSNLIQALENVAGVNQVSEGQAAVPAVRGLSGGRTLILIDGARVNSERRAGASATFLDPEVLESVEVARGPGSVAYGSDAFGGVIAVTTRKVAPSSPWAGRLSTTAGTGVPEWRVGADVSKGLEAGSLLVAAHGRRADDWTSPAGTVFNSGYRDIGVLAKVTHTLGDGYLSVGYQGDGGRDIERPRNNSRTVRFFYPEENSHRFAAEYDKPDVGPFEELGLHLFYGRYGQTTDQDRFATATSPRSVDRAEVRAHDFQFRGYGRRAFGKARWDVGVDVNGRTGLQALDIFERYTLAGARTVTENVAIDSARRVDSAVYSSLEAAVLPTVTLAGGARVDHISTTNRGGFFGDRDTSNGAASGYVAVTAGSYGGFTLTAQAARGFRDPVLSDRYFRGPSGRGFVTGNPDLDPEQSLQFDAGVRYTTRRVRAALFAYQYRISKLIERFQTTPDDFFFRNRGSARLRGVELETQIDLPWRLSVEAAGQVARGRALDGNTYLDGITTETGSLQVRRSVGARAFVQGRLARFATDDRPGPTERVVPGYTLVDLSGGATVGRHFELRALLRNAFDAEYFASQDVRAVGAPGRAASLTAVVRF